MFISWLILSWWWFRVVDDAWHCYTLWQSNLAGWKQWPFLRGNHLEMVHHPASYVSYCLLLKSTYRKIRKQFSTRNPTLVRIDTTIIIFVAIILHQASTAMQSPTKLLSEPFWPCWTVARQRTHHRGIATSSEVEASPLQLGVQLSLEALGIDPDHSIEIMMVIVLSYQ